MASKFPRDRLTGGLKRDPETGAILVNLDESASFDREASDNDIATRGVMRDSIGAVLVKAIGLPAAVTAKLDKAGVQTRNLVRDDGAKGAGATTAADDTAAVKSFRDYARAAIVSASPFDQTRNNRLGRVTIDLPAGTFVVNEENALGDFANGTVQAAMGLRIRGAGRGATQIVFAPPDGTDTWMWRNDIWSRVDIEDLTLYGAPSQTVQDKLDRDRYPGFLHCRTQNAATAVQNFTLTRVDVKGFWRDFIKLNTWDNNDSLTAVHCNFYAHFRDMLSIPDYSGPGTGGPVNGGTPDQALNFNFFGCQGEIASGNLLNAPWGGGFLFQGGSYFHSASGEIAATPAGVLSGALAIDAAAIPAVSATAFATWPSSGLAMLEEELVYYTSRTDQQLQGVTRGADFTVAAAHPDGVTVRRPKGGCLFLIPYRAGHASGTERFEFKDARCEARTTDSRIMACGWQNGHVSFQDVGLIKGQSAATHKPFRFHYREAGAAVTFDRCKLPYRVEFTYEDVSAYNFQRLFPLFRRCIVDSWDTPEDFVVLTPIGTITNGGSQIAVEFDGCRGQYTTDRAIVAFDCVYNYQRAMGAAPKKRRAVMRRPSTGNLPIAGITSARLWLPPGAKITAIEMYWDIGTVSGVTATSSNWGYTITNDDNLTIWTTDAIANPSQGFGQRTAGTPYLHNCRTVNKRRLRLNPGANNTQEPIGDCAVEYVA